MVYCRAHSGGIKNGTPSAEVSETCNHIDGQAVTPSQAASGKRAMVRRHHIASPRSQRRCLLCLPGVRRAVPKHTRRCGTISRRRRTGPRSPPGRQRVLLRGSHVPAVPRYHCRKGGEGAVLDGRPTSGRGNGRRGAAGMSAAIQRCIATKKKKKGQ